MFSCFANFVSTISDVARFDNYYRITLLASYLARLKNLISCTGWSQRIFISHSMFLMMLFFLLFFPSFLSYIGNKNQRQESKAIGRSIKREIGRKIQAYTFVHASVKMYTISGKNNYYFQRCITIFFFFFFSDPLRTPLTNGESLNE